MPDDVIRQKYLGRRLPDVECFMVLRKDRPVGLAMAHTAGDEEDGGLDLILLPMVRNEGIGSKVVAELLDHVRERRGWRRATVDPDLANADGIRFWRALGFEPIRRIPETDVREPYLLMAREVR